MTPDPRSSDEVVVAAKMPCENVGIEYNATDASVAKLNGNVTHVEEQIVSNGAVPGNDRREKVDRMEKCTQKINPLVVKEKNGKIPNTEDNGVYRNGPEQLLPTEDMITWIKDSPVKLKLANEGRAAYTPLSIPGLIKSAAEKFSSHNALATKGPDGKYQFTTYSQYYDRVRTTAKAFIKLGLERFHGVCILGFNTEEWFYSHLGAICAGGLSAGIYTTSSAEASKHCAEDCEAQIWVVEDNKQLQKVLMIRDKLPHLKAIIQYKGTPTVEGVLSWDDMMAIGAKESDEALEERLRLIAINQCCILIYTSGTTGPSKGVMLSHDNASWIGNLIIHHIGIENLKDIVLLSYLPLSHIAALAVDVMCSITVGATVYFAQPDVFKGSLGDALKEVRPTIFIGVPRVWEKIYEKMLEIGKKTTGVKRSVAVWAKTIGLERSYRLQNFIPEKPFGFGVANNLVFKKVKKALGLDRAKMIFTLAAPIALEVLQFFHSLNLPLIEIYGMSECTGPHTMSLPTRFKFGSSGITPEGCVTKIANRDEEGQGEICMGGRHVFMGYLNMKELTEEVFDEDGCFLTGDIGKFDFDERLFITGRIKEIVITAGGENVPPVFIEDKIKKELPCISNAMLIGDRRKFLSVLLTLKSEVDPDLMPKNELLAPSLDWCRSIGSSAKTVSEILNKPDRTVMNMIQNGIDETNKTAISNAQKIQKWTILPMDFSIPGGELGPTLKLRRNIVLKKYSETIEKFYS